MSSASTLIIATIPDFVSPEEHRNVVASTPSSFSDIRPVLRHKEENVSVTLDPPLDGFTPEDAANGILYVVERYVNRYSPYTSFRSRPVQCARIHVVHRPWIPGQVPRDNPARDISRRIEQPVYILSAG